MKDCCKKTRIEAINECMDAILKLRGDDLPLEFADAKMLAKISRRNRILELRKQGYTLEKIRQAVGAKYINSIAYVVNKYK